MSSNYNLIILKIKGAFDIRGTVHGRDCVQSGATHLHLVQFAYAYWQYVNEVCVSLVFGSFHEIQAWIKIKCFN